MPPYQPPTAVELRIDLIGITPTIWRRLLVPVRFDLGQLHHVIQAAFGWTDSHLHEFLIGGLRRGYERLLEVLGDPTHEDYADTKRWAGRGFDPERFNLMKADREVRAALRRGRLDKWQ